MPTYEITKNGATNRIVADDEQFMIDLVAAGEIDSFALYTPTAASAARIITKGAWAKRMGVDGLAIAGSKHPVCVAVSTYLGYQKCVDLDDPEIEQLTGLLKAAGQPAASADFPGSGPVTDAKIAAWIGPDATAAEVFAG